MNETPYSEARATGGLTVRSGACEGSAYPITTWVESRWLSCRQVRGVVVDVVNNARTQNGHIRNDTRDVLRRTSVA